MENECLEAKKIVKLKLLSSRELFFQFVESADYQKFLNLISNLTESKEITFFYR